MKDIIKFVILMSVLTLLIIGSITKGRFTMQAARDYAPVTQIQLQQVVEGLKSNNESIIVSLDSLFDARGMKDTNTVTNTLTQ